MKTWNKIASILTAMVTTISLLLSCNVSFSSEAADVWEEMSLTATELVDDITLGWNLGNTLECHESYVASDSPEYYETLWFNPVTTKEMIDTVKASGINAVRIPITWYPHMDENNIIDVMWMNRVQEVVDYVIENDMYCIINVHHDTGSTGWLKATEENYLKNKDKFQLLWKQIAAHFKGYDQHLIFEGFNEMVNDDNYFWYPGTESIDVINKYNQLFVDTVRATGGNNEQRCLSCNTYGAIVEKQTMNEFIMPKDSADNKLIAQVHAYTPWSFCDYSNSATTYDTSEVVSMLSDVSTCLTDKGYPTIIGEFACVNKNNPEERKEWSELYVTTAESFGIKCFWFDAGSLLARNYNQWKDPEILEIMLKSVGINYSCPKNFEGYALEKGNLTPYLYNFIHILDGGYGSLSYSKSNNSISMQVENGGRKSEDVQILYHDVYLEQGKKYRISFDASTDCDNLDVLLNVSQVYPYYPLSDIYSSFNFLLNQNNKKFEYTFEMPESENVDFSFCIGNSFDIAPFSVTISNLMVTEYTEKEMLKGDINLDRIINAADVILLQNYLLNRSSLTSEQGTYADLNQDATVNVSDLMLLKKMVSEQINQNLLPDMSEWTYHILDGLANINIDAATQTVQANVSQASAEQWQIETQAGDIALESGKAYQLTFDASCTTDTEMLFGITRIDDGNYPVCWRNTANLSTEMQTYSYTFTLRYSTQSDFYLYFDYGNTAGNYIIKNPKLIEVGTNLLPDVTDWTHYVSSGSAQMASDAQTQTFTANVTADGLYEWDIQAQARNLTLEKGKKYKLSVDMACSEETALSMGILHQVGSEYPACWINSVLLTPEKKTYTFLFDMTEETNSDWYLYFNFAESTGNYVISNAVLMEYSIVAPAEEYDYTFEVSELCCNRNGKNIYGLSYVPKTDKKVPLVILSHELNGTHQNMEHFAEALAGNGYAAYIFDFCGGSAISQSDGTTTEMSVMTEVSDLEAVLQSAQTWDFVDQDKIVLLGGSQGGVVTAITASRHIDEISGTILFYPAFILREQILSQFQTKEDIPDTFIFHKWISVGRSYAEDIWDYDFYSELEQNIKPVLVLHGNADTIVPTSYSEKAVSLYPNAEYHVIPDGGHGFYDQPFEIAKNYVLTYLEQLFTA